MAYVEEHAGALESLMEAGVPLTFTRTTRVYDEDTDTYTVTTSTVTGYAVRMPGKPDTYTRLGLVESRAPTLLFTASTFGDKPELGDTVPWAGKLFTVADVNPSEPDGTAILCEVIVQ